MRAYTPDLSAVEETAITSAAPSLEYDINLSSAGQFPLEIYRIPTLNSKGKVRFAVSVDNKTPIVVESAAADEGQGTVWVSNIFDMIEKHVVVNMPALSAGKHTIKLLPLYVPAVYSDGNTGIAEVIWNLEGLAFNSPGTVQVSGKLKGLDINTTATVEVVQAEI
ncbi:Ig-like domain-containing protein [Paenibacillus albidus]|uniref:Ig-like domain-containing protein n=1 Tax=Paenibacillus albidus TaxID=2041023 RepID=UPI00288B6E69|nr:Ig-like domain-containing protein [Paenibacillus albidus]